MSGKNLCDGSTTGTAGSGNGNSKMFHIPTSLKLNCSGLQIKKTMELQTTKLLI